MVLDSQLDWAGGAEISHIPPAPHRRRPPPPNKRPHGRRAFVPVNPWTHIHTSPSPRARRLHQGSLVVVYVLWFGQMCNDMYSSIWYQTEYSHCSKNPLCSACSSLSSPILGNPWSFYFFIVFPFPECHILGIIINTLRIIFIALLSS